MQLITHIKEAFLNLCYAKMRSFLAILGILVGTASVVALISSSQLATQHALVQFKSLGTNLLSIDLQQPFKEQQDQYTRQFEEYDTLLLKHAVPQIELTAPYITLFERIHAPGISNNGQVIAATRNLADIVKIKVARGRLVSYLDAQSHYCTIGSSLAKKIAQTGVDPIGQQLLLDKTYFTIIGILKPWKPNLFLFSDLNSGILIPLQTAYLISKQAQIRNILLRLQKDTPLMPTQVTIKHELSRLLPGVQVQFRNPQQIIDIVSKQRKTFTLLLASIGGIALLVGGIGVMNIMLVSVVERRREIGIRMAIGARQGDILMMFLVESIILTIFGGIVGIILGVLISLITAKISHWAFQVFSMPIMLGFTVSVLVGILSGFYPALRASRLDPIQSLGTD